MQFRVVIVVYAFFDCVKCQHLRNNNQPIVNIAQGNIAGIKTRVETGYVVNAFLGVPYAAPPVGNLRFLAPQRHLGWNGTYQAVENGRRCPQLPLKQHAEYGEDCLFLNIWTPEKASQNGALPVVIYFDGQKFSKSSSVVLSGQDLAPEGVVVVSVNYRLNVFGFFCLGNEEARGNFGILDQYFSLLWVRENIRFFGGDSKKITLLGHGSGAASVVLHMVSPRTAGLFQRAIVSSGSAVAPWYIDNDPIKASKEIIRILGCNLYQTNSIRCLRSKSVESILAAYEEYTESGVSKDTFYPVADTFLPQNNQYLPIEAGQTLKDGTYYQVPILTGITKLLPNSEEVYWAELASKGYQNLERYVEKYKIPEILKLYRFDRNNKDEIFDLVKWKYVSPTLGSPRTLFQELKQMEFDAKIEAPHFLQLNYLLSSYVQSIYVYYVDYNGFAMNTSDSGITSDLLLLFGPTLLHQVGRRRFNANELRLSNHVKHLWMNFITVGNPTPTENSRVWRKYTLHDNYIENIGIDGKEETEAVKRSRRLLFWTQLLPKISTRKNVMPNYIPKELQNSPDPAAGFRHGMYTLIGLVLALLALLLICIILLKKRAKDRERELQMAF